MCIESMIMNGLHIVDGNHLEVLAIALAQWLRQGAVESGSHPLATETVMVQSRGMQRWLSMAIAGHNGICANLEFPFPNTFLERLYLRMVGPLPEAGRYAPLPLAFAILKRLPALLSDGRFSDLRTYLTRDVHPLKEFQLARKIADVFDQYLVFRPKMIAAWESGNDLAGMSQWQPVLWRHLAKDFQVPHRAAMQQHLVYALRHGPPPDRLPRRLAVFGISHLPPFHLEVLEALACHIPVYLFLMNPCRQYWADIFSDRQKARALQREAVNPDLMDVDLYFECGNRLLSSWGGQGRQFFSLIHRLDVQTTELFIENPESTLLGRIQQDILDLEDRTVPVAPPRKATADPSVQIHVCHSPMREVEVLYDQLLDILDHDPDVEPRDIIVMTPVISDYAPYIQAVFGNEPQSGIRIPYSVADQSIYQENRIIEAFLRILDLPDARFEASRVLALMEYESIRRQFNIAAHDIETVETWIRHVNIRWGWDGAERKKHGVPGCNANTWKNGLDRLLLGYAMAADQGRLLGDTLPYDGIEGGQGDLLGNLIAFIRTLTANIAALATDVPLEQWREILTQLLSDLFAADESTFAELQILRETINHLADSARLAGYDRSVPFEAIRYHLADTFTDNPQGTGFMNGGVTFCAMLPMRSIPAKVVCLIGMQHDAFPRELREPVFNIMASDPKPGDRSKREDDKYLFLEALISARKTFYLSFVGRSQQDNADIPPSVLVDELTDYIRENFNIDPLQLSTLHPLQGFSPAHFTNGDQRLFTYSRENCHAGRTLQTPSHAPAFFDKPLAPPSKAWRECRMDQLTGFFSHPARFILENRLNLYLRNQVEWSDDRENFNLNALDRFRLCQQILAARLDQDELRSSYAYFHATGELPHGNAGKILYHQMDRDVSAFVHQLNDHLPSTAPDSIAVDLNIGAFRITGEINSVFPDMRIVFRMAGFRPQDMLSVFLNHLILNILALNMPAKGQGTRNSMLICKDRIWHFQPVAQAREIVQRYLDLYWQGLQAPLPFFPRTAWAYAQKNSKDADPQEALRSARQQWLGNSFIAALPGESEDLYNHRCFGHGDPLTPEFEKVAMVVFGPILDAAEQTPV